MNNPAKYIEDKYGECAESWAYKGRIVAGSCIDDPRNGGKPICSTTNNFEMDRKFRFCTKASGKYLQFLTYVKGTWVNVYVLLPLLFEKFRLNNLFL